MRRDTTLEPPHAECSEISDKKITGTSVPVIPVRLSAFELVGVSHGFEAFGPYPVRNDCKSSGNADKGLVDDEAGVCRQQIDARYGNDLGRQKQRPYRQRLRSGIDESGYPANDPENRNGYRDQDGNDSAQRNGCREMNGKIRPCRGCVQAKRAEQSGGGACGDVNCACGGETFWEIWLSIKRFGIRNSPSFHP